MLAHSYLLPMGLFLIISLVEYKAYAPELSRMSSKSWVPLHQK